MDWGALEIAHEPSDGASAAPLLERYYAELAARFPTSFDPGASSVLARDLLPPRGAFLVARMDGCPIACGGLRGLDELTAELKRMWVEPRVRGRGVGRRMLAELESVAARLGYRAVRLDTSSSLTEAIGLYRSSGYAKIAPYNDNIYAGHWFEKHLL